MKISERTVKGLGEIITVTRGYRRRVHEGRRLPSIIHNNNQQRGLFKNSGEM
jgi:hypothetical protein